MANLEVLVEKLNPMCRATLMEAAALSLSLKHEEVDIEHLFLKLSAVEGGDLPAILAHYDVSISRVESELTAALEKLKGKNERTPGLSRRIQDLLEKAWLLSSCSYGADNIRSGHLLVALLIDRSLSALAQQSSKELGRIDGDDLKNRLPHLVPPTEGKPAETTAAQAAETAKRIRTPGLDQYTVNVTERAKMGQIDAVLGRDAEIRQMIDILLRRRQNNPILTGEAGVGKTAVVEGFACRVAAGEVPEPLKEVEVRMLDISLLQAGASMKGEFENRLKTVIQEVKSSPIPIILFIDEAHMLIGAGGTAGVGDAANIMKPALARGELRTIAATTWAEYKKYFENDAALTRRFQLVKVEEPSEQQAAAMLRGLLGMMQEHHKVRILDEAIVDAVRLSRRYIAGRQLPDKAVSVLDTACARVALGQAAVPAEIEDCRWRMEMATTELETLSKESALGADRAVRLAELAAEIAATNTSLQQAETRWQQETELVAQICDIQTQMEARISGKLTNDSSDTPADATDERVLKARLQSLTKQLQALQAGDALVYPCVNADAVADVISTWTGIPVGKMLKDDIGAVQNMAGLLRNRIVGQDHAIEAIARRIKIARTGLEDPSKPVGVFLLVGPSGVGKTETALALADVLYGGERNIVTINMSEYQEAHTVSGLKGAPPGYVGYGKGGVLTEAVRRKPYCVVLLDEIEKAHRDVLEMFYQVFDKGVLVDSEGVEVNFKNTVIILTSNVGTATVTVAWKENRDSLDSGQLQQLLRPDLLAQFTPAFLGRLTVVPYFPIGDGIMRQIVNLKLKKVEDRLLNSRRAKLSFDEHVINEISARCCEVDSGARNVDHILTGTLLPEMSDAILARVALGKDISEIRVSVATDGTFAYSVC